MTPEVLIGILALVAVGIVALLVRRVESRLGTGNGAPGDLAEDRALLLRDEFDRARTEANLRDAALREEVGKSMAAATEALAASQKEHLTGLGNQLERQVRELREGNEQKLDQMRATVDEKLQGTLEKRLGEAFAQVSQRLEAVHEGLGEMKQLAEDVGDFKKVLTNVKSRGTWGEVQLRSILEEVLAPSQWEANVKPLPDSDAIVEFAIRLPGRDDQEQVWLPVDAKFPQEDYARLQEAQDRADPEAADLAGKALGQAVVKAATDIRDKYLGPPLTTEFGILFLPTEGLYAEVLRRQEVADQLQRLRITVAGPTTLAAILNAFRMGFHTLAIEQRSSEVWAVLGAVKTEFGKFGDVLAKLKKQLGTAQKTIDDTGVRTRAMERRLREVEEVPDDEAQRLLDLTGVEEPGEDALAEEPGEDALAEEQ